MPTGAAYSARLASEWLTTALMARRVSTAPEVRTQRQGCRIPSQSALDEVITARPPGHISLAAMHAHVSAILRSARWRIVPVPPSKVPRIGLMVRHPIDIITRGALRGAVNILPDIRLGAYALIFINSGCQTR
jgi:hypothetical protein